MQSAFLMPPLSTSQKLDAHIRPQIRFDVEELWAFALSSNLKLISADMLFRGHASACLIHPREIYRYALQKNAVQLALAHSHPSGDHEPSSEDLMLTQELYKAGNLLKIPLIDHLILSENGYFSMRDAGCFARWERQPPRGSRTY